MKRDLGSPLAPTFGGGDLKKRLAKRKMRTEAKVERKNIKSAGKNQDAKNKGYASKAHKNAQTAADISTSRTRTVKKGPKNLSTSTSTSTSNREGDKNRTTVTVNKNKTTIKKPKKEKLREKRLKLQNICIIIHFGTIPYTNI